MHELSIVNALIELCEKNAKIHSANKITKVHVKIGSLSGIEPHFFKITFDTFKEKTICDSATLILDMDELKVACFECGATSKIENNEIVCPICKSIEVKVIEGEDMILQSLEMQ